MIHLFETYPEWELSILGSNSVRLVVFDGAARSPAYFFNEKIMCGLGVGLSLHGRLNPEGRNRAISAIARFKQLAKSMGIDELTAVATAAVRTASDGQDFCQEVMEKTGQFIAVISGCLLYTSPSPRDY